MKKLTKIYLAIVMILVYTSAISQNISLKGSVFNANKEIVDYANVILLSPDSTYLTGVTTSQDGSFMLNCLVGEYILQFQALGYKAISKRLDMKQSISNYDVTLEDKVMEVTEVVVTSKKPIIQRTADRIIFNAESVAPTSNNAYEVLKNVPGVIVDHNGGVQILGSKGVKVLINGKEQKLGGRELMFLLESYQADMVDKVEVLTAPPARFAAEGNAGVLNIKMKKITHNYLGGSVAFTNTTNKDNSSTLNANVLYSKDKIQASISAGGSLGASRYLEMNKVGNAIYNTDNSSEARSKSKSYNIRGNFDYTVNKNLDLGFLASYSKNNSDRDVIGNSSYYGLEDMVLDSLLHSVRPENSSKDAYQANIYVDSKLGNFGKTMHFDIDYLQSTVEKDLVFTSQTFDPTMMAIGDEFGFNNDNGYKAEVLSTSLDFALPFGDHKVTVGARASFAETNSKLSYYNHSVLDDQYNDFVFQERIYAMYLDYSKQLNEFFSFRAGVRFEHTHTIGSNANSSDEETEISYPKLFPTLFFGYKPNDKNSFNLSVSGRVNRPGFRFVNPFDVYISKYAIVSGNPNIKPSYSYVGKLGYTWNNNLSIEALYIYDTDMVSQVSSYDDLILNTKWDNAMDSREIMVQSSYFLNTPSWMQVFFIQGASYQKSFSNTQHTVDEAEGFYYIAMLNGSVFFDKEKKLVGSVNAYYKSPTITAVSKVKSSYNVGVGLRYNGIFKSKFDVTLNLDNILASNYRGDVNANNYSMSYDNKYSYMTFKFGVTYRFGAKLNGKRYTQSDIQRRL